MNSTWLKYLPAYLQTKLVGRHGLQAILGNTGWLFADKIIRMGVGLFVGVWVARYLGPEQFGLWSYATAFTALFGAFASLGLDSIVIRELVKYPGRQNELLGSAFVLKLFGGVLTLLIAIVAISLVRSGEANTLWLVGISAAGFIFQSVNVIDFYFQAKVRSKYTVYAANGAFALMTIVKIVLLLNSAPLIAFAWAGLAEIIFTSIFLMLAYRINHQGIRGWRFRPNVASALLKDSWPLILSGIAIMIYMRIDQIMIGQMLGDKEVGLFSAAVRISEVWYFIPLAIVSSVFPSIIEAKQQSEALYLQRLQKLLNFMSLIGLGMAILMTFTSHIVVQLLFGAAYAEASTVLAIHIWAGIFVALGVVSGSWLTVENLQKYSFYRTLNGAVANVLLNFLLIPKYGINGAAAATVLSYGISVFSIGIYLSCREVFFMMCLSVNPFQYRKNINV